MTALLGFVVLCGCVVVVVWLVATVAQTARKSLGDGKRAQAAADEDARQAVEALMLDLMVEFPDVGDAGIVQLTHDRLVNHRIQTRAAYEWCTVETAGRMRRGLAVAVARKLRKRA